MSAGCGNHYIISIYLYIYACRLFLGASFISWYRRRLLYWIANPTAWHGMTSQPAFLLEIDINLGKREMRRLEVLLILFIMKYFEGLKGLSNKWGLITWKYVTDGNLSFLGPPINACMNWVYG